MPREKNPRTVAVDAMRSIRARMAWLVARWEYYGKDSTPKFKRQTSSDYPENDPAMWQELAEQAAWLAEYARDVEDFARIERMAAVSRLQNREV